ncbi:MAG: EAL domain-containing protein [Gammaproteobacteria bacterium]|nr:EAL domain-containing protein [Gammaproteobacteria bacterium]
MPKAKILVVDDIKANLVSFKVLLKNVSAKIIIAASGQQALDEVQKHDDIALILLDIEMPEMNGFEVAETLQDDDKARSIPIIFVTGHHQDEYIEKAYLAGAADYIQKPIRKTPLLSKVQVFLNLWKLRSDLDEEVQQRKNAESRVKHMASHDLLTGLYNRRGIYAELNRLIHRSERYSYTSAVIFIDLDGFKNINDRYGHVSGDLLLKQISNNLIDTIRITDTVGRMGGDEFIVLVGDIKKNVSLIDIIEKLLKATTKPLESNGNNIAVSSSIGISLYPDHGSDTATLLHHADQAMFQAKKEGENTFRFFTEEVNRQAHRQVELQNNIKTAIMNDELSVYFQPIVDVSSGRPVSAEALLRWESASLGVVAPDEFIPAAENSGLISELGCWVLEKAIETSASWRAQQDIGLRIAVNASTIQFHSNLLYDTIKSLTELHNWDPSLLEVEITEGLLLDDSLEVRTYINQIHNYGARLSVDDFGTGFSALSYLKNFPVSTVKIDRSFIMDIPQDKESKILVKSIIAMAHGLGLEVIAEGVETEEQWQYLQLLGCDFAQGYFFGRPMPKNDFTKYLETQSLKPGNLIQST